MHACMGRSTTKQVVNSFNPHANQVIDLFSSLKSTAAELGDSRLSLQAAAFRDEGEWSVSRASCFDATSFL